MNNICKRSLSLLLALAMVLGVVPMGVLATEAEGSACDHANAAVAETIAATCMGDGYNTWVCECGATWQEPILAAGHNYVTNEAGDAQVCSGCGDTIAIQQEAAPVSEPVAEAAPAAEVVSEVVTVTETTSDPVALATVEYENIPEDAVVGLVWLDKNNENALLSKVMQGGLRDLVLNAIGADVAGKAVVTYTDGKTNADVSNPTAMLMAGLAYPLYDAIAAQQTLVFTVEEDNVKKDVYIVCRNLRTAEIKVSAASVSSEGAPADLAAKIDDELAKVTVTVTHNGDDLTELAAKDFGITKKSGADYTWPEAGETAEFGGAVTVSIRDDLDVYTKEGYGSLFLVDTTPKYTVTYKSTSDGAAIAEYSVAKNAATPTVENPEREYYTFEGWYNAASPADGVAETVTCDVTYVAIWAPVLDKDNDGKADQEQSYTITFDYNYPTDVTVEEPAPYTVSAQWGTKIADKKPTAPTLNGYNFAGWDGASGNVAGNVTVKATWYKQEADSYNVTYYVEGEMFVLSTKDGKAIAVSYIDTEEDYIVWLGWHTKDANGEYVKYDFDQEVTDNSLVLYGVALDDGDNDNRADGTAEDAYTVYVYMFSEYEAAENKVMYTKTVWADKLAEGETYDPESQAYAKDSLADTRIFAGWKLGETAGEQYSQTCTYYPVFKAEVNQNGVADPDEQTGLKITKPESVTDPGKILVDGVEVSEDAAFTRDSVNGSKIVVELNGSAVVTKISLVPEAVSMSLYGNEETVEGEVVLELAYSNNYKTVTATMPADNSNELAEGTTYALNVVFRDARALELKVPQDTLDLRAQTTFTEEDIYNALVKNPEYNDTAVTVTYKARETQSGKVSVQELYNTVKAYESVVPGAWTMLANFLGLEKVNGVYYYSYSLDEQWETVDFKPEDGVVHNPEEIIGNYVTELSSITDPTKITELVNNMYAEKAKLDEKLAASNIHPFGYNPTGASEVKETVDIVYKDVTQELRAEGVDVVLTDSRTATTLTAADMTFTYGQFSKQDIIDKLTLTGSENKSAILLSDDTVVNKDAGTYQVTATYPADETYKSSSVTFNLTVEKASATIIMDRGVINQESFNFAQVKATADPADAAVLQVIAGWDMTTGDIDLSKPVVNSLKGKAWVIAPDDVLELVKMALQLKYGYVPTNLTLAQMTELVTNHRSALENHLSKENVDRVLSFLTRVSAYVAADMDIVFGEPTDVKTGVYMNLAVLADSNYEGSVDLSSTDPTQMVSRDTDFAYGAIVISPVVAIPNRGGVQLTYNEIAENIFVLEDPAEAANIAVTVDGNPVENTIYFYGVNGEASVYNSTANANKAPDQGGVYVASTVYYAEDGSKIGSDTAIVFLGMVEADIDVEREVVVYDEAKHAPDYTVTKSDGTEGYPDIVMISGAAGVDKEGELDLTDLTGEINIDVPQWMGDLWAKFVASNEGQQLGLSENHKLPATVSKSTVISFLNWCIKAVDEPVKYLEDLGIDKEIVKKATGKLRTVTEYATEALELVKEKVEGITVVGDTNPSINIQTYLKSNGKAQVTGYTDKGVYPYVGIIADSDFVPAANAGVLVITGDPSDLIMWDTDRPYGSEQKLMTPITHNETKREGVTIIRDMQANALTVLVEEDLQKVIEGYIEEKLGVGIMNTEFTLNKLVNSGADWTSELADKIINKLAEMAVSKMPDRFDDNVEGGAEKLQELKDTLLPKLVEKLKSLEEMTKYGNVPFTVKADAVENLPTQVGKYQFYTFSYGMVYDSAMLTIHPTYFYAVPNDAQKVFGEQDPDGYEGITLEFYSYNSVEVKDEEGKTIGVEKETVNLAGDLTVEDLGVDMTEVGITREEGENVGEYDLTLTNFNYNVDPFKGTVKYDDTKTGVGTFTITPKKLTVNINDIEKYFGDPDPIAQMKVLVDGTAEGTVLSMDLSYVGENANEAGYPLNATDIWSLAVGDSADNYDLTAIYEAIQSKKMIIHKAEIIVDIADITDLTVANTPADLDIKLANKVYTVNAESKGAVDNLDELIKLVVEGEYVTAAGQLKNGVYNIVNEPAFYKEQNYTITFNPGKLTVGMGDYICWNMQTEKYYDDVSVALGEAVSGETVQMLKDATADINQKNEAVIVVGAGVTFDLNGYYVETANMLSYGVVVDSSMDEDFGVIESGGIKISNDTKVAWTQLQPENGGYIPVYDTVTGSYKFFKGYVADYTIWGGTESSVQFWIDFIFENSEGYKILGQTADSNLSVLLYMDWSGTDGINLTYTLRDETVKDYGVNAYNDIINPDVGTNQQGLYVTVKGLENIGSIGSGKYISAQPALETVSTVTDVSENTMVYTIP